MGDFMISRVIFMMHVGQCNPLYFRQLAVHSFE